MKKLRIVVTLATMIILLFPYSNTVAVDSSILHHFLDPGLGDID